MTFTTLTFLLFLVLVFGVYWSLRSHRAQNLLLLVVSYFFYGWWDYRFCGLMLLASSMDFTAGRLLGKYTRPGIRRTILACTLVSNLGMLAFFKYFNFFAENLAVLMQSLGWHVSSVTLYIVLPVGISFYTFQSISYTIDVYRGDIRPVRNLIEFLAFVSFFPQLVAGPIERAGNLLGQFGAPRRFDAELARDGCRQMLWGFFKKVALADNLGMYVDLVYGDVGAARGPELGLATFCFAFQIYCDFSAYSDIAIGSARLLGFSLMRNFAYPYFSQSASEFWRRWHISLSTWFRDYVYLPLGGSRVGPVRRALNVLLTFAVSGFWHGAAWNFVIWGTANGAAVAPPARGSSGGKSASQVPGGDGLAPRPAVLARIGVTFVFICATWVFFRARTFGDAMTVFYKVCTDSFTRSALSASWYHIPYRPWTLWIFALLGLFIVVEWVQRRHPHPLVLPNWPRPARWALYTLLLWGFVYFGPTRQGQFIYFQF